MSTGPPQKPRSEVSYQSILIFRANNFLKGLLPSCLSALAHFYICLFSLSLVEVEVKVEKFQICVYSEI